MIKGHPTDNRMARQALGLQNGHSPCWSDSSRLLDRGSVIVGSGQSEGRCLDLRQLLPTADSAGRRWGYDPARRGRRGPRVDAAFVLAVVATLAFAFTNGFHDAANAIATLVATRGARPGPAILLAAVCNLLGPLLLGAAVADTIAGIVEVTPAQTVIVVGAGLTAAVAWNLVTWWRGLPSSSSHALIGGLVGAALVEAGAGAVNWGGVGGGHSGRPRGGWRSAMAPTTRRRRSGSWRCCCWPTGRPSRCRHRSGRP
jgi:Phosphate transporter family